MWVKLSWALKDGRGNTSGIDISALSATFINVSCQTHKQDAFLPVSSLRLAGTAKRKEFLSSGRSEDRME